MSDRDPVEARDLDIYGAGELAWDGVRDALRAALPKAGTPVFLGTVRPDGRFGFIGHAAPRCSGGSAA